MTRITVFILLALASLTAGAQSIQNMLISANDNVRLDFQLDPPIISFTGILFGFEAIAHAENGSGDILFWVNSDGIYNANSELMAGSSNMYANSSSTEMNICPIPGEINKYYVIYNSELCTDLYYAVVDMDMNSGLGGVESTNTLLADGTYSEGLEIVRIPCSNDYRLLAFDCSEGFVSITITPEGFSDPNPLYSYSPGGSYDGRGELDYHNGRIGQAFAYSNKSVVGNYDIEADELTDAVEIAENWSCTGGWISGTYGVDFSQDGSKAYIATWGACGSDGIGVYDFETGDWSTLNVGASYMGQIELAPDGKIYCLQSGNNDLIVIENPNDDDPTTSELNVTEIVSLGISDHIQSELFSSYNLNVTDNCVGNEVQVEVSTSLFGSIDDLEWFFDGEPLTEEDLDSPTLFTFFAADTAQHNVEIYVNSAGCLDTIEYVINIYDLTGNFLPEAVVACEGESTILQAPDIDGDYLWSTDETTAWISVEDAGYYWLFVQTPGCAGQDSIYVDFTTIPDIMIDESPEFCEGSSVVINASTNGEGFYWSTGAETESIAVAVQGNYTFYAFNEDCINSETVYANMIELPPLGLPEDVSFCDVEQGSIVAGAGYDTYTWSNGDEGQSVDVTQNGALTLVAELGPCQATGTVNFDFQVTPNLEIPDDQVLCDVPDYFIDITTDAQSVQWSSGQTYPDIYANTSGEYTVTVSNGLCSTSESILIQMSNTPPVPLNDEYYICDDDLTLAIPEGVAQSVMWSSGNEEYSQVFEDEGTYWIELSNAHCDITHNFSVEILDPDYVEKLVIPNIFTPNGDEQNDYFELDIVDAESMNVKIYDRWGIEVFSASHPSFKWDGSKDGQELDEGLYFYLIEFQDVCFGDYIERGGYVHLVRKL